SPGTSRCGRWPRSAATAATRAGTRSGSPSSTPTPPATSSRAARRASGCARSGGSAAGGPAAGGRPRRSPRPRRRPRPASPATGPARSGSPAPRAGSRAAPSSTRTGASPPGSSSGARSARRDDVAVRRRLSTRGVRRRTGRPGTVALTFDDGPDPVYTPRVLDALAAEGAVATFFLVGRNAARHPELVRRIVAEGHGVGSHTWSHPELAETSLPALVREVRRGRRELERLAGSEVRRFRPPKGHTSAAVFLAGRAAGVITWNWSLD